MSDTTKLNRKAAADKKIIAAFIETLKEIMNEIIVAAGYINKKTSIVFD